MSRIRIDSVIVSILAAILAPATFAESIYPVPFHAGQGTAIASIDLDGDGDVDLATAGVNGLLTLTNDGTGNFIAGPKQTSNLNLFTVTLAKLNADNAPDALVRNFTSILAYPGNGAGGFLNPLTLLVGTQYGSPRTGDFNEDGRTDVVVGHSAAGVGLTVFFSTAAGPVNPPVVFPGGGGGGGPMIVSDINGDGHLDVIDVGNTINTWLGDGFGHFVNTFNSGASGTVIYALLVDFDHDGKLDLLYEALTGGTSELFRRGDGAGGFAPAIATSMVAMQYVAIDFDHDGVTDLIGIDTNKPGIAELFRAVGPVQFAPAIDLPVAQSISSIAPIDVDADGNLDLVIAIPNGVCVLRAKPSGGFVSNESFGPMNGKSIATGDVNDDGYEDLVTVQGTVQLGVSLGSSGAPFPPFVFGPTVSIWPALFLDLGDLDLDGDLDAAVIATNELDVLHGDGTGGFSLAQAQTQFGQVYSLLHARLIDSTSDGVPDLTYAYSINGGHAGFFSGVVLARGIAGGTLGVATPILTGSQEFTDLLVSDLNGDGAADFVVALPSGTPLYVRTDGIGGFLAPLPIPVSGAAVRKIASGDVNGDGKQDLVFASSNLPLGLLTMLGTGSGFAFGSITGLLSSPSGNLTLACADVNGDARLDVLALGDYGTPILEVLRGDGAGNFADSVPFAVASNVTASRLHVFDAEHDGRVDVVFAAPASSRVETLRNALPDFFDYAGAGCAGSGGFVPRLRLDGVATPGGSATLSLENAKGGATALLFTGVTPGNVPLPGGCPLLVFPLLPIVFNLPLSGTQPGEGSFHLGGPLPGSLGSGSVYYMQAIVIDPGASFGFAATNRAQISVY